MSVVKTDTKTPIPSLKVIGAFYEKFTAENSSKPPFGLTQT